MSLPTWQFEHSLECRASREFAWRYWTDPANWNDPPAKFEFDGPFEPHTNVKTLLPGQVLHSMIRSVDQAEATATATIEMRLPGALVSFTWSFVALDAGRTRIAQRIVLSGPAAGSYIAQAAVLEDTAPRGMARLTASIESAFRGRSR